MKIAILIERFRPTGGGAERSTHQIARQLVQRGHEVTILAGDAAVEDDLDGITVRSGHTLNFRHRVKVGAFARWSRKQLATGEFDTSLSVTTAAPAAVVQPRAGTVRENIARNIAIRKKGWSKAFKVFTLVITPKVYATLRLERRTMRDPIVKRFVAVSEYVSQQLQSHYGVAQERIAVVPNAAEMPIVTDDERREHRRRVREGFGVPQDAPAFMFASYNPKLKGARPLLHAMKRLTDQGHDAVLMMAGEIGFAEQQLAAMLGIRDRVKMIGPTNRIVELYCAADATVLPTYYDAASKVVIESLMMGVPAITTRFNGACDLIVGSNGQPRGRLIDDPNQIDALAAAMIDLLDPAERQRCAAATAGLAEQLSMKRHVDQLEAVLRDAAGEGEPPVGGADFQSAK